MILYITRKFSPSIGGMQRFNDKLVCHLRSITDFKLIVWGGSQIVLPFFMVYAFFAALIVCLTNKIHCIYVSDGVLSPLAYLLKIITRKPVIANIHGSDILFDFKLYQMIVPWYLRRMNKVICVSDTLRQECMNRHVPEKILQVIPNGIDIEDFDLTRLIDWKQINDLVGINLVGRKIIISVGRLISKKGVQSFLINIFPYILQKFPDIVYLVVGDGPVWTEIKNIIREKGYVNNVFMLGKIPMDGPLVDLYRCADVFVMPNILKEGFGIVVIEAGAAGLPVVASRVGGIDQAIQNGENGFLIDYGDYEQFAKKVIELLENPQMATDFGSKAREFVEKNYSWKNIAREYSEIFNQKGL